MVRQILALLALTTPVLAQDPGLALWEKIHSVFAHPRCANCHVGPDNVPMWSGPEYNGGPRPHGMNINGGTAKDDNEPRDGAAYIPCSACHAPHNSHLPHGPPGATGWALAPLAMQWFGKSSKEICEEVKDPKRNRGPKFPQGRTIATGEPSLAGHIAEEALVQWGWAPGRDRQPPPYSAAQVVQFLKEWEALGAPCPTQ